uniref:RNA-directed DNA polymerase n=1 Tax=Plectus sambesii TaxID=2011161 RepID=A0A914WMW9_9BILA
MVRGTQQSVSTVQDEGEIQEGQQNLQALSEKVNQLEVICQDQVKQMNNSLGVVERQVNVIGDLQDTNMPLLLNAVSDQGRNIAAGYFGLPRYSGDISESMTFSEWIKQYEDLTKASYVPLTDQQKLNQLCYMLTGKARKTLDKIPANDRDDYEQVKRFMKNELESAELRDVAKSVLAGTRQKLGESVEDFAARLERIVYRVMTGKAEDVVQEKLLDEFLDKLNDDIAFYVNGSTHVSFESALAAAIKFERLLRKKRGKPSAMVNAAGLIQSSNTPRVPHQRSEPTVDAEARDQLALLTEMVAMHGKSLEVARDARGGAQTGERRRMSQSPPRWSNDNAYARESRGSNARADYHPRARSYDRDARYALPAARESYGDARHALPAARESYGDARHALPAARESYGDARHALPADFESYGDARHAPPAARESYRNARYAPQNARYASPAARESYRDARYAPPPNDRDNYHNARFVLPTDIMGYHVTSKFYEPVRAREIFQGNNYSYNPARNSFNNARYPPRDSQCRNDRRHISDEQRRENRDFKALKERERQEKLWRNHVRDADGNRPSRPNTGNYQFERRIDTRPFCTSCKQIGHLESFCYNRLPPADLLPPQNVAYRRASRVNVISPAPTNRGENQNSNNTNPPIQTKPALTILPSVTVSHVHETSNNNAHLVEKLCQADARIKGLLSQNERLAKTTHPLSAATVSHQLFHGERKTGALPVRPDMINQRGYSPSDNHLTPPSVLTCPVQEPAAALAVQIAPGLANKHCEVDAAEAERLHQELYPSKWPRVNIIFPGYDSPCDEPEESGQLQQENEVSEPDWDWLMGAGLDPVSFPQEPQAILVSLLNDEDDDKDGDASLERLMNMEIDQFLFELENNPPPPPPESPSSKRPNDSPLRHWVDLQSPPIKQPRTVIRPVDQNGPRLIDIRKLEVVKVWTVRRYDGSNPPERPLSITMLDRRETDEGQRMILQKGCLTEEYYIKGVPPGTEIQFTYSLSNNGESAEFALFPQQESAKNQSYTEYFPYVVQNQPPLSEELRECPPIYVSRDNLTLSQRQEIASPPPAIQRMPPQTTRRFRPIKPKPDGLILTVIAVLGLITPLTAQSPSICQTTANRVFINLPKVTDCSIIPITKGEPLIPAGLQLYHPNSIKYESDATLCKIVTQSIQIYVNFWGAHTKKELTEIHNVSAAECNQMANYHMCPYGEMIEEEHLWQTTNRLDTEIPRAPWNCCAWMKREATNCFFFKTKVYAHHGSNRIESPAADTASCLYLNGECTLLEGSALIWTVEKKQECEFAWFKSMEGKKQGNAWLSDDHNIALTWDNTSSKTTDCGRQLLVTHQEMQVQDREVRARPEMRQCASPICVGKNPPSRSMTENLPKTVTHSVEGTNSSIRSATGQANVPKVTVAQRLEKRCQSGANDGKWCPKDPNPSDKKWIPRIQLQNINVAASSASPRDHFLPPTVVSTEYGTCRVSVTNPSNEPKTLYANMRIAQARCLLQLQDGQLSDHYAHRDDVHCMAVKQAQPVERDPAYVVNLDKCDLSPPDKQKLQDLICEYDDIFAKHKFHFEYIHVKGIHNGIADCLSRGRDLPPEQIEKLPEFEENFEFPRCFALRKPGTNQPVGKRLLKPRGSTTDLVGENADGSKYTLSLRKEQLNDSRLGPIIRYMEDGTIPNDYDDQARARLFQDADSHSLHNNGCLFLKESVHRRFGTPTGPVTVPDSLTTLIWEAYHSSPVSGGHLSYKKTLEKMTPKYYWPSQKSDIYLWTKSCLSCQMRTTPKPNRPSPMISVRQSALFHRISLDLIGPYPRSSVANATHVLHIVDCFSKYAVAVAVPDQRATTLAKALMDNFVLIYGSFAELQTDNASSFRSHFYQEFCELLRIRNIYSTPRWSRGNAIVERQHQNLQSALSKYVNADQKDFDVKLPYTTPNSKIRKVHVDQLKKAYAVGPPVTSHRILLEEAEALHEAGAVEIDDEVDQTGGRERNERAMSPKLPHAPGITQRSDYGQMKEAIPQVGTSYEVEIAVGGQIGPI